MVSARTYLFEGKIDGICSPGAGFFSITTYKSQKIGEVSIFVTTEILILHFKCFKINFENRPYKFPPPHTNVLALNMYTRYLKRMVFALKLFEFIYLQLYFKNKIAPGDYKKPLIILSLLTKYTYYF
jgi:hypothetical protein